VALALLSGVEPQHCHRLHGGSAADCVCRLPGDGWRECPPSARGIIRAEHRQQPAIVGLRGGFTGDACDTCGLFTLVRTGTCQTCISCGASSAGCS
jgi:hypothetical protein